MLRALSRGTLNQLATLRSHQLALHSGQPVLRDKMSTSAPPSSRLCVSQNKHSDKRPRRSPECCRLRVLSGILCSGMSGFCATCSLATSWRLFLYKLRTTRGKDHDIQNLEFTLPMCVLLQLPALLVVLVARPKLLGSVRLAWLFLNAQHKLELLGHIVHVLVLEHKRVCARKLKLTRLRISQATPDCLSSEKPNLFTCIESFS